MDDQEQTNLLLPFYMLCGMFMTADLVERKLLSWQTATDTSGLAKTLIVFFLLGLSHTFFNWLVQRQFKASILSLFVLTTLLPFAILSPPLGITAGLIFILVNNHTPRQNGNDSDPKLSWLQRLALLSGGSYVAAASIQFMTNAM